MSKLAKTVKGALAGVMGTAGVAAVGTAQAGGSPPALDYEGTDADWSDVYCDRHGSLQGLKVDVRFDGPREKCLRIYLDTFEYTSAGFFAGEWNFWRGITAYYGDQSQCATNYGKIGSIAAGTDLSLAKFEVKWTDEAKGPGKPNHKFYTNTNTVEIELKKLGEVLACD